MHISGWIKQSLMDFPGKIAAVVFTQGCNFQCPYCHNPELWALKKGSFSDELILQHFEKNRLLLDGVVITGGEPTLQPDLLTFSKKIKSLGLSVKLDTNGTNPELVKELIDQQLVDYIAMDIKTTTNIHAYSLVSGIPFRESLINTIRQTIHLLIDSEIEHEFRTTICKELISLNNIKSILKEIEGSQHYYLQQYQSFESDKKEIARLSPYEDKQIIQFIKQQHTGIQIDFRN